MGETLISVTKTYLPPLDQYISELEIIWRDGWITNNGRLSKELTERLCAYLGVNNLELVANGTLALQLAIKALRLKGEVITTPFSYVATTTAILWEDCEPVFVDIEDKTFCIDADQIESAITERTNAILATHVYGYPCDVQKIEQIAQKYDLKVIYDAAHAFGVKLNGESILNYGDVTALSFHATKLFHTAEGGALICRDENLSKEIGLLKKFGHVGEDNYIAVGINAKMSELHAAMGLCVLLKVDEIIEERRILSEYYERKLEGLGLFRPQTPAGLEYNYSYFPVIFSSNSKMLRAREALIDNNIAPRRYFYPSLNTLGYLNTSEPAHCPKSEEISETVLCLPLYSDLDKRDIDKVCQLITKS